MLTHKLLRNHAGMLLVGDYDTLRRLHEVAHDVAERSPLTRGEAGETFLGLAYDVRKAFEGQRRVLEPPASLPELGPRYGVEILWPVILVQQRVLRCSLAFIDHGPGHQAVAYDLEHAVQCALRDDFESQADVLVALWKRVDPAHPAPLGALASRGGIFCSWGKAERERRIVNLLESFDPMYGRRHEFRTARGTGGLLTPEELAEWDDKEWPDPRW